MCATCATAFPGVDRLGGDNAVVAARQFLHIAGRIQPGSEVGRAGEPQSVLPDCVGVLIPEIVGPDFDLACLRQVRGKQAAHSPASDYANFHRVIVLSSSGCVAGLLSGVKLPGNIGQALAFSFADAISVLRIEADFAVGVHDLRMKREDHVLLKLHVALRPNRRILEHGRSNAVAGKVSQSKTFFGERLCHCTVNIAGQLTCSHELSRFLQGVADRRPPWLGSAG